MAVFWGGSAQEILNHSKQEGIIKESTIPLTTCCVMYLYRLIYAPAAGDAGFLFSIFSGSNWLF